MWFRALSVGAAALAVLFSTAWSPAQACALDAECAAGEICLYPPCAAPCDPDDESCEMPECDGVCVEDTGPSWQECVTDADCENDWVCEVIGGSACADVICADGGECPEPEPCQPEEFTACVPPPPAPCVDDSDCDEGLVCVTYSYMDCPPMVGRDCPEGSECPEPEPVDCEEETESYCVPSYFAPCEVDADCGEGFACVEGEMCGCSGGGGTPVGGDDTGSGGEDAGGGGSDEPTDDWSDCFCEPTGELYCELQELPCMDEADCPEGFLCEYLPDPTVPCTYDAETGETWCEEPGDGGGSDGQCIPAEWQSWVGDGPVPTSAEDYDDSVGAAVGGEAQADGRASEIENPPGGGGGTVTPGTSGSGGDAGGCSVAGGSAGLGLALMAALALVLGTFRPRRRR